MNKKVLILDDDINIIHAIKRNLRNFDYELFCFTKVDEALEALSENEFALVICDYYLQNSIGTDVLQKVKTNSPNTVRVLMTGKADLSIASEAINKVNIFKFILKPLETNIFIDVINQSLRQFHLLNLEKIDNLKNEFFAIISHEFRTPFTSINNYLELIQLELNDLGINKSTINNYISSVYEGSDRILRTINLIVNLAQAQTDKSITEKIKFNLLAEVINNTTQKFTKMAEEKNLNFHINSPETKIYVTADIMHIFEIYTHLVENAFTFTDTGSVKVDLSVSGSKAFLSVIDTGIGISEDYHQKIFEPFIQENRGYSRKYEGNGLGLTLVKKYCELNNLDISIESEKEKGSTFTITFNDIAEQL